MGQPFHARPFVQEMSEALARRHTPLGLNLVSAHENRAGTHHCRADFYLRADPMWASVPGQII